MFEQAAQGLVGWTICLTRFVQNLVPRLYHQGKKRRERPWERGWVVQRQVNFNPGLNSNFFSRERFTVLIKYSIDFPRKLIIIPQLQLKSVSTGMKTDPFYDWACQRLTRGKWLVERYTSQTAQVNAAFNLFHSMTIKNFILHTVFCKMYTSTQCQPTELTVLSSPPSCQCSVLSLWA